MKFSTFVKLGGHAFNLLQNKDMMELYGMVKPGIQNQVKKIKETPAATTGQPQAQYPVPIDSPFLGLFGSAGRPPADRPPYNPNLPQGAQYPPGYPYGYYPPYPPYLYRKKRP